MGFLTLFRNNKTHGNQFFAFGVARQDIEAQPINGKELSRCR